MDRRSNRVSTRHKANVQDALPAGFSEAARAWFASSFDAPTLAQVGAWTAIASGSDALVIAPTGSGKTLAAFLAAIDRLAHAPLPDKSQRCRVLYISPLKALAVDVDRNLAAPLSGLAEAGAPYAADIRVQVRTGDTPANERARMLRTPPDILVTTPESLFLLLTSRARETLASVDTIIIDEIHAVAGTKRGAHLALSLERLASLLHAPAQRIGLSATVEPPATVASFLSDRPVTIVRPPASKTIEVSVVIPVDDLTSLDQPRTARGGTPKGRGGRRTARDAMVAATAVPGASDEVGDRSIWPDIDANIHALIEQHTSTIVFCNSRRLAERLCGRINDRAGTILARAHHGSVAREQRTQIEEALKSGELKAVIATSSLELGIDMGAVDLVIQVEAPPSVASGLQRIGRAGHQVGAISRGVVFPKYRGDLVAAAVAAERIRAGAIETLRIPANPLDVLAQHVVAMVAMDDWKVSELAALVRRAAPYRALPESSLVAVLDMLAGRYPSDAFAELRPRLVWDREADILRARPGAQRLAVISGGTIPDRGLYGVYPASGEGGRIGELDEEQVYESRVGETFVLGASTWRIEDITRDRVLVSPAPGLPGRMPFWKADQPARPIEFGRALGAFVREIAAEPDTADSRLTAAGLDARATSNLLAYIEDQRAATGVVPSDRTIVIERFRDEVGDWRICILSPFGAQVHAPWALAIERKIADELGIDAQALPTDDGIVLRLPDADRLPDMNMLLLDPDTVHDDVLAMLGSSTLFSGRFRECALRALLIPRRMPGQRMPLWQTRQRAHQLLGIAANYASFPIVLEAVRECMQDHFDVPALEMLMRDLRAGTVKLHEIETPHASPFAQALTFSYLAVFVYEHDQPLAERRAHALSLDQRLLAELLGADELRDLIDPTSMASVEDELQWRSDGRRIRHAEDLADALRTLGDLSLDEIAQRVSPGARPLAFLEELTSAKRAIGFRMGRSERFIAIEDASRYRDALSLDVPLPPPWDQSVEDPVADLVARYARTHAPFQTNDAAGRLGLDLGVTEDALHALQRTGAIQRGAFRDGPARSWVDTDVLRRLRRRSLAAFRREVEPVEPTKYAAFLQRWQHLGTSESLDEVLPALLGVPVPASDLPRILAARGISLDDLEPLTVAGELTWFGNGPLGENDGWITLARLEDASLLIGLEPPVVTDSLQLRILETLSGGGAFFFRQIADRITGVIDTEIADALWFLAWRGLVTTDAIGLLGDATSRAPRSARTGRRPSLPSRAGPPRARGRWSVTEPANQDPTRRAHTRVEGALRRHGVLVRGSLSVDPIEGGWAAARRVLSIAEETGACRRGYFVERLGGAQFGSVAAIDHLRTPETVHSPMLVAACDPAQPYGAALSWPETPPGVLGRPGRKAGASVILREGAALGFLERGGKTLTRLDPNATDDIVTAIADAVRAGRLPSIDLHRIDAAPITDAADALEAAGFRPSSRGWRMRG